jgi:hypothetical protein
MSSSSSSSCSSSSSSSSSSSTATFVFKHTYADAAAYKLAATEQSKPTSEFSVAKSNGFAVTANMILKTPIKGEHKDKLYVVKDNYKWLCSGKCDKGAQCKYLKEHRGHDACCKKCVESSSSFKVAWSRSFVKKAETSKKDTTKRQDAFDTSNFKKHHDLHHESQVKGERRTGTPTAAVAKVQKRQMTLQE